MKEHGGIGNLMTTCAACGKPCDEPHADTCNACFARRWAERQYRRRSPGRPPLPTAGTRTCTACGIEKPLDLFYSQRRVRMSGEQVITYVQPCKRCHIDQRMANREKAREAIRAPKRRNHRPAQDTHLINYFEDTGGKCMAIPENGTLCRMTDCRYFEEKCEGKCTLIEAREPHTLDDIGLRFAVTRERIRQIEAKAARKFRNLATWYRLTA